MSKFCCKDGSSNKVCIFSFLPNHDAEQHLSVFSLSNKLLCFEGTLASFLIVCPSPVASCPVCWRHITNHLYEGYRHPIRIAVGRPALRRYISFLYVSLIGYIIQTVKLLTLPDKNESARTVLETPRQHAKIVPVSKRRLKSVSGWPEKSKSTRERQRKCVKLLDECL